MAGAQSADLFLKVSSFTRYLLDDVLPAEVQNKQGVLNIKLENLVDECDALVVSLQTFKQLTKAFQGTEAVPGSSQTNNTNVSGSLMSDVHNYHKFTELCDVIRKKVLSLSDLMKFKPCYCKICNFATWYEHVFNQHCSSKRHVEQTNQTPEPLTIYKCKICYLLLMAPQSEIHNFVSVSGHSLLDDQVQKLKGITEKLQIKNVKHIGLYKSFVQDKTDPREDVLVTPDKTVKSDSDEKYCVPQKVNQLFQLMKKKLEANTNLSDIVPHYCNVCDIMAYSVSKFIEHSSSKEHISAVNAAIKPINVFKCEKCGFLITGYQVVIDGIINSMGHRDLDVNVKTFKASQDSLSNMNESFPLLSGLERSDFNSAQETSGKRTVIPEDLKNGINIFLKKLTVPQNLKKYAPAYCYLCSKFFFSNNDFKQHLTSRKHHSTALSAASSSYIHDCPTCLISLYGTDSDVSSFIDSVEHINLHKSINYLLRCNRVPNDSNGNTNDKDMLVTKIKSVSEINSERAILSNISESKEMHVFGLRQNITGFSEYNQNINQDSKSNLAQPKRLDKGIPDKFLTINSKLQCGNFSKSGFCRPCKKGVNITKGWGSHLLCSKHRKAMGKIEFANIPLSCNYCPLEIVGGQIFGNVCMDIHMKLNHPNEKPIEMQRDNFPVTIKEEMKDESLSDTSSGASSGRSKSSERRESSTNGKGRNNVESVKEDIHLTTEKNASIHLPILSSSIEFYNSHHFSKHTNQESNIPMTKTKDSCVGIFTKILEEKKTVFLNEGLKQFGGMCLLCVQTFEDYYDWLIHLKDLCHINDSRSDVIERECSNCNLSLYGQKVVIDTEFWSLQEHTSLDELVTQ